MSNMTDLWLSGVFFQALNTPILVFGPPGGSLRRSPRHSSGLEKGTPPPAGEGDTPRLCLLGCQPLPPTQIPGYAYGSPTVFHHYFHNHPGIFIRTHFLQQYHQNWRTQLLYAVRVVVPVGRLSAFLWPVLGVLQVKRQVDIIAEDC